VLVSEFVVACVLLRWLPVKRERWIPALPFPVIVVLVLLLRFTARVSWATACVVSAALLWGVVAALLVVPVGCAVRAGWAVSAPGVVAS
jgi:hypothetical protein